MESTGVYWIPLFQILEERGLEVCLVNARDVDLTRIPGIRTGIAQALFREIGPDFTKFRSASAFASWMGLCPENDISGGKVLFVVARKVKCRAALALRMAAQSLHHSKSALGDFYRRMARQNRRTKGHHGRRT